MAFPAAYRFWRQTAPAGTLHLEGLLLTSPDAAQ
jgi:hypothetical protein